MGKIFGKPVLIFFIYLISLLFPFRSYAAIISLPYSDDFEDGNIFDNWSYISGTWNLEPFNGSTWLGLHTGSVSDNEIQIGDTNLTNYEFEVDVHKIEGEDLNFFFRIQPERFTNLPGHNIPTGYGLHMKHLRFALQKFTTTSGVEIPTAIVSESFLNNTIKNIKVRVEENTIKVFTENSNVPIINYTDNDNPFLSGGVALASITGGAGADFHFDNFLIESTTPTPTPTPTTTPLPVPDLKQYSLPWKNQVYDRAMSWSDNPSIERWGCALTSASMILKFWGHGDYANPDLLNNWLRTQPDGYIGDGYLNWLAVTRFSLIHSTPTTPALEFRRIENTNDNLDNELASGRPAILKVPGHFFVATGKTPDSYSLNDPAHNDRPTLASYENSFTALNTFTPTYTDLSYLLLTINPAFNLKIFDKNGDEILVNPYIEDPLSDDLEESSSSAKPLKIYLLPKPVEGQYIIEVSNSKGPYQLSTYIYDKDGEVDVKKKNGRLNKNNSKDKISLKVSSKKKWHLWPLPPKFPWPLKDWGHE